MKNVPHPERREKFVSTRYFESPWFAVSVVGRSFCAQVMLSHNIFLMTRTAGENIGKKAKKWLFFPFENQRLYCLVKQFLQDSVQEKHLFKDLSNPIIYNNLWDTRSGYFFFFFN